MFPSFTILFLMAVIILAGVFGILLYRVWRLRGQKMSWLAPHSFRKVLDHKVDTFAYFLVVAVREFVHHAYLNFLKLLHKITLVLKYAFHMLEKRFGRVVEDVHARKLSQDQAAEEMGKPSRYLEEIKEHTEQVRNAIVGPDTNL